MTQHIKEILERTNKKKSKLRKKPKPYIEEHDGRGRLTARLGLLSLSPRRRPPPPPPPPPAPPAPLGSAPAGRLEGLRVPGAGGRREDGGEPGVPELGGKEDLGEVPGLGTSALSDT